MNQGLMDEKMHSLFQHFCDIMTWGIKKVPYYAKIRFLSSRFNSV